jgi:hypothetical protein
MTLAYNIIAYNQSLLKVHTQRASVPTWTNHESVFQENAILEFSCARKTKTSMNVTLRPTNHETPNAKLDLTNFQRIVSSSPSSPRGNGVIASCPSHLLFHHLPRKVAIEQERVNDPSCPRKYGSITLRAVHIRVSWKASPPQRQGADEHWLETTEEKCLRNRVL